ncbi:DNA replication protein [Agyrium rufum]|nr:DNA replication protein [Agyrium rufum]
MSSSYYSVSSILTDAQKIPCTFTLSAQGLGYLDGNAGGDIKSGQTIPLPLYLARSLATSTYNTTSEASSYLTSSTSSKKPFVLIDLPDSLSSRVLNALKADPKTVDLRAQEVYFYEGAAGVLELMEGDEEAETLEDTFRARAEAIADHANNTLGTAVGGEAVEFLRGLDEGERQCK